MDELQEADVEGFIYIVNMTNRHQEIHEKTREGETFFGASRTCLINLLMSFLLRLLKVYFFKHKNKP